MSYTIKHGPNAIPGQQLFVGGVSLSPVGTAKVLSLDATLLEAAARGFVYIVNDTPEATPAEINRIADVSQRLVTLTDSGTIAITDELLAEYDRRELILAQGSNTGVLITLPRATGTGAKLKFNIGVVNTGGYSFSVAATTSHYAGRIVAIDSGNGPGHIQPHVAQLDAQVLTLNGTTSGGSNVGCTYVTFTDLATDFWAVSGSTTSTGVDVTPFGLALL